MAFQVSPGVNTSEIDLTTVIPAVASSTGAIAGPFQWGPVGVIRQVSNEIQLVSSFGKPSNDANAAMFFTAANFLAYTGDLRVVRAANAATYTAYANLKSTSSLSNKQIKSEEDYDQNLTQQSLAGSCFGARYPGSLGNSLQVSIWANTTVAMNTWTYSSLFDKAPNTSNYILTNFNNYAKDELHLVVVDTTGAISGVANTVLEKYAGLSKATNAKDENGQSLYYKDVLFRKSKYIYHTGFPEDVGGATTKWGVAANNAYVFTDMRSTDNAFSFINGTDVAPTNSDVLAAYGPFKNSENVDISLVMTGNHNSAVQIDVIDNLVGVRKDCVAFISPTLTDVQGADPTSALVTYRTSTLNRSSSYTMMDSGWKYQYDKYNDVYRWVPLNGDIAGLCARTDTDRDPWWSPAGLSRGQIKNVIKLAYNPTKANRDELYKNDINPVVSFPGEGTILYGDKTMQGRPSAFDRINVRRLFIVLEKSISKAARSSLFEFNDEFTRAQFVNLVEPFLRNVQGRRGIYDFRVVCDESNNTPEVVDRNEFVGDIYIKPAKSINFIQLNFVAVRSGVAFEEVVGKF